MVPPGERDVVRYEVDNGVAWLTIATDGRWSAARAILGTIAIGLVLLLVAVARSWNEFDHANVLAYVYIAGLVGTLTAIIAIGLWMHRRTENEEQLLGAREQPLTGLQST